MEEKGRRDDSGYKIKLVEENDKKMIDSSKEIGIEAYYLIVF